MSAAHKLPEELVRKIELMAYKLSPHPLAAILEGAMVRNYDLMEMEYNIRIGWDREYLFSLSGRELTTKFKFLETLGDEEVTEGRGVRDLKEGAFYT